MLHKNYEQLTTPIHETCSKYIFSVLYIILNDACINADILLNKPFTPNILLPNHLTGFCPSVCLSLTICNRIMNTVVLGGVGSDERRV